MKHVQPVSVSNAAVPALSLHTCLVSLLCETAHLLAASCTKASTALFCSCGAAPRAQMKRQTVNEAARMGADSFYTNSATIPVLSYPWAGEAWRRAACSHSMESCTLSDWPCWCCCCCCCSNFLARRRDMRQTERYYNKQKIYRASSRLSPLLWMFYAPFWNAELISLLMWRKTSHKKSHQITTQQF